MDQINEKLTVKLELLLTLLSDGHQELEKHSAEIPDPGLRTIVSALADENLHSVKVLSSLTGMEPARTENGSSPIHMDINGFNDDSTISANSLQIENVLVKAYREILNLWFPNENLRRVLQFQLNGIKSGFMKMRIFIQLKKEARLTEISVKKPGILIDDYYWETNQENIFS